MAASNGVKDKVYKVFTEGEWKTFQKTGRFSGSADDIRDGFIHLSTKEQVSGVVEKFFSGKRPLYIAEFSGSNFIEKLKWEISDSAGVYPHLYGVNLFTGEVTGFTKLNLKRTHSHL